MVFFPSTSIQSRNICCYPQHKKKLNTSIGLISARLFCKDARGEAGEYCIFPLFLFHLSGDERHHHHFSLKGYSIFSFALTEPVGKGSDKLLKRRDRHRDSTGKKIDTAWSFVLQEYGEGKKQK